MTSWAAQPKIRSAAAFHIVTRPPGIEGDDGEGRGLGEGAKHFVRRAHGPVRLGLPYLEGIRERVDGPGEPAEWAPAVRKNSPGAEVPRAQPLHRPNHVCGRAESHTTSTGPHHGQDQEGSDREFSQGAARHPEEPGGCPGISDLYTDVGAPFARVAGERCKRHNIRLSARSARPHHPFDVGRKQGPHGGLGLL